MNLNDLKGQVRLKDEMKDYPGQVEVRSNSLGCIILFSN